MNLHLVSQNRRPGKTRDGRAAYRSMLTGLTRLRTAEPRISLCPHFSGGVVLLLANGLTLPVRTGPPPGGLVDEMPTTAGQWRSLTKSMPDNIYKENCTYPLQNMMLNAHSLEEVQIHTIHPKKRTHRTYKPYSCSAHA